MNAPGAPAAAAMGNSMMVATTNLFAAIVDKPIAKKKRERRGAAPEGTLWKKQVANSKDVVVAALKYARRVQSILNDIQQEDVATFQLHEVTSEAEGLRIGYEYSFFGGSKKPGSDLIKYPHKSAASLFQGKKTQFGVGYAQLDPNHLFPDFLLNEFGLGLRWSSPPLLGLKVKGPLFGWIKLDLHTHLDSVMVDEKQGVIDAQGLIDYLIPTLVWA